MADKELNIKVKADVNELTKLTREVNLMKSELLKAVESTGKFSQETAKASDNLKKAQANLSNAKNTIKEFGEQTKMSKFQLLEFGENITVVVAGILGATKLIGDFVGKIYEIGRAGAEFQVLKTNFKGGEETLELFRKATANTVTDAGLIKLSNQASDLGISLKEQAMLFSLAEDAADKYGGSVEENFSKVVMATEGNIKGLKSLGIQKELFNQKVTELVKNLGGETEAIQGSNGERELSIKKLDAETQKRIRVQAILELTGSSLEKVAKKEMDVADKMAEVNVKWENFKTEIGGVIALQITKEFDSIGKSLNELGITSKKGQEGVFELVGTLMDFSRNTSIFIAPVKLLINSFNDFKNSIAYVGREMRKLLGIQEEIDNKTPRFIGQKTGLPFFTKGLNTDLTKLEVKTETEKTDVIKKQGSAKNQSLKEEEVKLDRIEKLLKDILDLETERDNLIAKHGDTYGIQIDYLEKITKKQEELNRLQRQSPLNTLGTFESPAFAEIGRDLTPFTKDNTLVESTAMQIITEQFKRQYESLLPFIGNIQSVFQNMMSALNINANTFVGTLVSGFDTVGNIINTIISTMQAIQTAGGFFKTLTSILGFADGGLFSGYGSTTSDSNLVRVSNGEFIVNAESTKKYLPLLSAINNKHNALSGAGMFANGGMVRGGNTLDLRFTVKSTFDKDKVVRIFGSTLNPLIREYEGNKSIG